METGHAFSSLGDATASPPSVAARPKRHLNRGILARGVYLGLSLGSGPESMPRSARGPGSEPGPDTRPPVSRPPAPRSGASGGGERSDQEERGDQEEDGACRAPWLPMGQAAPARVPLVAGPGRRSAPGPCRALGAGDRRKPPVKPRTKPVEGQLHGARRVAGEVAQRAWGMRLVDGLGHPATPKAAMRGPATKRRRRAALAV